MRHELPASHEWSVIPEPNGGFRVETVVEKWLREATEIVRAHFPNMPAFVLRDGRGQ